MSVIIILIYQKLGFVGPVQQKIKLLSPYLCFKEIVMFNLLRAGITCQKIFYKNLLNSECLWSRARLAINTKNNYSHDYFHIKISLKFLVKSFLHAPFLLITWNIKLLAKQLVECPQQILANYVHISWRAFQLLWLDFEDFKISWFIWQSIFDHF